MPRILTPAKIIGFGLRLGDGERSCKTALEEIAAYRLPDAFQQRAHILLAKNREGTLSSDERAEMEEFRQIDHLLTLIKAKAQLKLKAQS